MYYTASALDTGFFLKIGLSTSIRSGFPISCNSSHAHRRLLNRDQPVQVDQAVAKKNGVIAKDIAAINDAMKTAPRIAVDSIR